MADRTDSTPPTPSDDEIIQSLIGTESRSPEVTDLVNKMIGTDDYASRSDGNELET